MNEKISKIKYTIKKNKIFAIAEKDELQNKIKELEIQNNNINNELVHAVNIIYKKNP